MNNNYVARIIVAIIFIPTILWISYQGGWWLFGMLMLFALIAIAEFLYNEGYRPNRGLYWLSIAAVVLLFIDGTSIDALAVVPFAAVFFLISGMALSRGTESPATLFVKHCRLLWGVVYVGLLYPIVYLVGSDIGAHSGGDLLLFLFGIIWVGDTFAMEIGRRFGKHKLSPSISPNKSVEGFVGGLIGAALVAIIMYFWKMQSVPIYHLIIVALGCSVFGQLGDLVESMWKRSLNIKDSSSVIPGHGGVLDRFDSLLFAAPFLYVYFRIVLV